VKREDVTEVLNDPIAQELLQSHRIARLAYDGLDGYPRAIPIGYFWSGHDIVICTPCNRSEGRRPENQPKVALTIDTETQPPHILLGTRHRCDGDCRRHPDGISRGIAQVHRAGCMGGLRGSGACAVQADGAHRDHARLGESPGL